VTLTKLRFLLTRAVQTFGDYYLDERDPVEISAWRMRVPPGYRFEATQALRQVLARAVLWRILDINPAKLGVENPQRRRREKRPFESWEDLEALADRLGSRKAGVESAVPKGARRRCSLAKVPAKRPLLGLHSGLRIRAIGAPT
jgi:hypothetical protein